MCDYSTEHYRSVKAEDVVTFRMDRGITHGFITTDSCVGDLRITAVCVLDGQRLAFEGNGCFYNPVNGDLTSLAGKTGTVVQRKKHRTMKKWQVAFAMASPYNDFIDFGDGMLVPVMSLTDKCTVTLLPAKPKRVRNLVNLLGLDNRLGLDDTAAHKVSEGV